MAYADLHIHSIYSDGTLTPAEIVRTARANGVGLISVCDHNVVQGTLETARLAKAAGLDCISGVEIDAIHAGLDVHILCYGADLENEALLQVIRHARAQLDGMSDELLRHLKDPRLDEAEYAAWPHDPKQGGWKLLQYLKAKGATSSLREGFPLYDAYGVTYADAGFDSAETVIAAIHGAGGRAVLAHPGVVFPTGRLSLFAQQVEAALDLGLDGVECHYPRHDSGLTRCLIEICQRRQLMITAGSDCHGAFNHNAIGQTKTPIESLVLDGLVQKAK